MAAAAAGLIGELGTLLGGTGIASTLLRGAITGLGAVAASDLIKAVEADLSGGSAQAKAQALRVPKYAIVDIHNDSIVRTLSSRKVYSILTHPSRKGRRSTKSPKVYSLPQGSELVTVR